MEKLFKVPLILEHQEKGGWTVTSPVLPELITEVDDLNHLHDVVADALRAVLKLYEDTDKEVPSGLITDGIKSPVWFESLVTAGI